MNGYRFASVKLWHLCLPRCLSCVQSLPRRLVTTQVMSGIPPRSPVCRGFGNGSPGRIRFQPYDLSVPTPLRSARGGDGNENFSPHSPDRSFSHSGPLSRENSVARLSYSNHIHGQPLIYSSPAAVEKLIGDLGIAQYRTKMLKFQEVGYNFSYNVCFCLPHFVSFLWMTSCSSCSDTKSLSMIGTKPR